MFILTCNITIGRLEFTFVNAVEVISAWENLTDTARITLPSNIKVNRNRLRSVIAPGDVVRIDLGYDGRNRTVFQGYVTGIKPATPIEITCEDESYQLKQNTITDTMQDADLQALLDKHFPGYQTRILNTQIGTYQIDNWSQALLLDKIKEQFGLYSFFRDGVLVVGRIYDSATARRVRFRFQYNIIEDDLEYRRKEDVRLLVHAISNQPGGERIEVRLGDPDGQKRSLNFYKLSKEELEEAAQRELDRLKYDGYHGTFTAFGEPPVRHGDIVVLEHPEDSDKQGSYFVDSVEYTFGVDGFRQKIKLGPRA